MTLKERSQAIKIKIPQLYLALKDKSTPWYAKALGAIALGYALSPIDLIPDFIPVIGYLDDLLVLTLLVGLTIRLIPKPIWEEKAEEAKLIWRDKSPRNWIFAGLIISFWAFLIMLIIWKIIY